MIGRRNLKTDRARRQIYLHRCRLHLFQIRKEKTKRIEIHPTRDKFFLYCRCYNKYSGWICLHSAFPRFIAETIAFLEIKATLNFESVHHEHDSMQMCRKLNLSQNQSSDRHRSRIFLRIYQNYLNHSKKIGSREQCWSFEGYDVESHTTSTK